MGCIPTTYKIIHTMPSRVVGIFLSQKKLNNNRKLHPKSGKITF